MKYIGKYKKIFAIAITSIIGLASLLIWSEREDRIHGGGSPNSRARHTLIGIWQDEMVYLSEHSDFARSLSKLKSSNRIEFYTIEFIAPESNSQMVVYRAIPDRFNWLMFDLSTYTIAIVKSNSIERPVNLVCYSPANSKIIPKIEVSVPLQHKVDPVLKCSKGSHEISDP
jgi:hypothetical protein